jgi:uncharacterized damage-inducible protein DinB
MTTAYTSLLEEALEAWYGVRMGFIEELENMPEDRMDFRPAGAIRSVAELVRHVIEFSAMMAGELTREDGDFCRQGYPGFIEEYASHIGSVTGRDELIAMLRSSHAEADQRIRDAGELAMLQHIRRFDGLPGTRLAWFWSGVGHEDYHKGQMAMYARMMGLVPVMTQRTMESEG